MAVWIVFIISLVIAVVIANAGQQLLMKIMGASGMFFSMKKKLIAIVVIALILCSIILKLFGIEVPK